LVLSDKMPFFFGRGAEQVEDAFEMVRIVRGLSRQEFEAAPYTYTVVNTNSPRQLDVPMAQAIIDFARAGQIVMITPFTLSGAMAPVTVTGALMQQHAEAMMGITLSQIVRPGAPVVYGGFTSNVDMHSGAPAFGTPEYVKAAIASGQLTRHVGIPFRSSNVNASNAPDAQAAYESMMSSWGALMGGAHVLMHAAGWLEGGLVASFEKYIIDIETLQTFAETFTPLETSPEDLARSAMEEVGAGGHYFGAAHTLERYSTAYYEPIVSDWSNHGQWVESGSQTTAEQATAVWKRVLDEFVPADVDEALMDELDDFIGRRVSEGGAPPVST
jgi:trimethylamine--corrinoid protein Co-methyltransferase